MCFLFLFFSAYTSCRCLTGKHVLVHLMLSYSCFSSCVGSVLLIFFMFLFFVCFIYTLSCVSFCLHSSYLLLVFSTCPQNASAIPHLCRKLLWFQQIILYQEAPGDAQTYMQRPAKERGNPNRERGFCQRRPYGLLEFF